MNVHRLPRADETARPAPVHVEFHGYDCDCGGCPTPRRSRPAKAPELTFLQIGNLVWLGLAIGSAIAFAIDPHGAWLALTTVFTGGR